MTPLLLDQGLPRRTADILREDGWDVVHVAELGFSRALDADLLEVAWVQARACVTLDADFHAILATSGATGPSVVRIRIERLKGGEVAALLSSVWPRISADVEAGALVTITARSVRVRRLPIGGPQPAPG